MRARDLTGGEAIVHDGERLTVTGVSSRNSLERGGEVIDVTAEDGRGASRTLGPMPAHVHLEDAPPEQPKPDKKVRRHTGGGTASITEPRVAPQGENIAVAGVTWRPIGAGEVARWLGVKEQTVRKWRHNAVMPQPSWFIGGRPVWRSDRIETWAKRTGRWERSHAAD